MKCRVTFVALGIEDRRTQVWRKLDFFGVRLGIQWVLQSYPTHGLPWSKLYPMVGLQFSFVRMPHALIRFWHFECRHVSRSQFMCPRRTHCINSVPTCVCIIQGIDARIYRAEEGRILLEKVAQPVSSSVCLLARHGWRWDAFNLLWTCARGGWSSPCLFAPFRFRCFLTNSGGKVMALCADHHWSCKSSSKKDYDRFYHQKCYFDPIHI